jgi:integrative and conjugative element protein (TIGR02256 family)
MWPPIIYQHPFRQHGNILVESLVFELLDQYRQNNIFKSEAGGILLGYRREDHLHVVKATTPQPCDRRSLFRFFRRDNHHQRQATILWEATGETMDYVGEWHTHPERYPTPSTLDLIEWKKICAKRKAPMLFLIAGSHTDFWVGAGERNNIVSILA